jgi:hypothetical protein
MLGFAVFHLPVLLHPLAVLDRLAMLHLATVLDPWRLAPAPRRGAGGASPRRAVPRIGAPVSRLVPRAGVPGRRESLRRRRRRTRDSRQAVASSHGSKPVDRSPK